MDDDVPVLVVEGDDVVELDVVEVRMLDADEGVLLDLVVELVVEEIVVVLVLLFHRSRHDDDVGRVVDEDRLGAGTHVDAKGRQGQADDDEDAVEDVSDANGRRASSLRRLEAGAVEALLNFAVGSGKLRLVAPVSLGRRLATEVVERGIEVASRHLFEILAKGLVVKPALQVLDLLVGVAEEEDCEAKGHGEDDDDADDGRYGIKLGLSFHPDLLSLSFPSPAAP